MKVETITEQLLFATLRIEAPPWVGTGFIVGHRWAEDKEGYFLVTNRHVVEGTPLGKLRFTLATDDADTWEPDIGKTKGINLGGKNWRWTYHPLDEIDVAAMPLTPILEYLNQQGYRTYYRSVGSDDMPGDEELRELDALEEIIFVGYPSGLFDESNNIPIFRKGITATPPFVDYDGRAQFLIDASVFHGSSGSPVFLYNTGARITRQGESIFGSRLMFLGILGSGYYRKEGGSVEFQEVSKKLKPVVTTEQMIDLGVVHKASTVKETIEQLLRDHGELSD